MSDTGDAGKPPRRLIDGAVKARFVAELRAGTGRDEAARRAGFSAEAFYCARKRDPLFKSAWVWALELSAVEQREARRAAALAAEAAGQPIAPNNKRVLQRRRARGIGFTDERKRVFLDHFAGTADTCAAADAAGVHYSTFHKHYRRDAEFAAACDEALEYAYLRLEADALRQRIEAQRDLREGRVPAGDPSTGSGQEMAQEFERVMRLLARYDRRGGGSTRPGSAVRSHRALPAKKFSFDEAAALLDRRLNALCQPQIAGGPRDSMDAETSPA